MSNFFIKKEGEPIQSLVQILTKKAQEEFNVYCNLNDIYINPEIENNSSAVTINKINYPNITYAVGVMHPMDVETAVKALIKDSLQDKKQISIRKPISVTQDGDILGKYTIYCRFADISSLR